MNVAAFAAFVASGLGLGMAVLRLIRHKRVLADWIWVAGMVTLSIEAFFGGLGALSFFEDRIAADQIWRLLALSLTPGIWLIFSLTYARGEAVQFLRRRWWEAVIGVLALPVFAAIFRGQLLGPLRLNTANAPAVIELGWAGVVLFVAVLVASILVLMNLERTFRAAVGTVRWRIKFMLMGIGLLFVVRIYTSSQALLFRGIDLHLEVLDWVALIVASVLIGRSYFRTRHIEVDVYPSQSVLQNSITILAAGSYLVLVGVLAKVAAYFGGDNEFALKAFLALISLVALAIFLQSDRIRMHLRRFVSRNFQRPLYDYRTVWRKFTEGTASRVERNELSRSLVKMIADVFQSLSVAIWLWDEKKEGMSLAASTFLPGGGGAALILGREAAAEMTNLFQALPEAVDLDDSEAGWAAALRQSHPSQFPNGGHRISVPLLSQGQLIGLLTLGDRVGGVPFSIQDFDMLRCVADDAASELRNVQLSERLLQAKELEAFQTMAAFFVHDLKNAASTLNLMLQNLPVHFDDPAFREDALRGVAKTVSHIDRLIGRLGLLRHEHTIQATENDFNDAVTAAMGGLEQAAGSLLIKELRPLPKIMIDREQFGKVVTNLVLNATEAVSAGGHVRVETRLEAQWVVLSVQDDGSGMSPEFLAKGLFRPFQTTKKTGLGIGMFQSKMIVEGHGGRIAVASTPGEGTTFEVFLPLTRRTP